MTPKTLRTTVWTLVAGLGVGVFACGAYAWGPRAERSIAAMAMQIIQREHPNVFMPDGGGNFSNDVFRGANDGLAALGNLPMLTEIETLKTIDEQIQLLRDVRAYGPSSYFAYRMGVLSTLTANVMLPYGYARSEQERNLQQQIRGDIEQHLDAFRMSPVRRSLQEIRDTQLHFKNLRPFHGENLAIIADEYRRGIGYSGFLKQAAPKYFEEAVLAVADVWHTTLLMQSSVLRAPTDRGRLTEYFVNEVDYLLNVKDNYQQANRVYPNFRQVNPGKAESYERLGDLYYQYGLDKNMEESIERGVREWQVASELHGATHQDVSRKLSNHYLRIGQQNLDAGQLKGASNDLLPAAMVAFETAIKYDPANRDAPGRIEEVQRAVKERQDRLDRVLKVIASADQIKAEAERHVANEDFGNAIMTYSQAMKFYEGVDDYFTDLYGTAKQNIEDIQDAVSGVVRKIEDKANDAITDGDSAREGREFDVAINHYQSAIAILDQIPDEDKIVGPSALDMKKKTVEQANKNIEDTKTEQLALQRQEAELAGQGLPPQ